MYLSKDSMDAKFGRRVADRKAVPGGASSDGPAPTAGLLPYREVESYLDYQADRFVDRFDANSYLYLLAAMDDYDLAAGHGSDADALAGFDGEALALSFTGDWHFTVEQSARLADAFRAVGASAVHHVVDSDYGHDAFLTEPDLVGPPLRDFLADGVRGRAVADAHGDEPERRHAPVHSSLLSD
jgi:homoserine O-acetyltransferase